MDVNRLLHFTQLLYKTIESSINTDPHLIESSTKPQVQNALLTLLVENCFTKVPQNFTFPHLEQRRLTSKLLTMLVRDFYVLNSEQDQCIFRLCIQNLIYFQRVFQNSQQYFCDYQAPTSKYFDGETDPEDIEIEIKSYIQ